MSTDGMNPIQNPDNDANQSPGETVQVELTRRGWTHADLADRIGKHRSEVSALIAGSGLRRHRPWPETMHFEVSTTDWRQSPQEPLQAHECGLKQAR